MPPAPSASYTVRLDPWAAEYEGSLQLPEGDGEPSGAVDVRVERASWQAVRPEPAAPPARAWFVDGVRRIEHRLLIEAGGRTLFGLLGSTGVGAVEVAEGARVAEARVARVACVGGGLGIAPLETAGADGGVPLEFVPEPVAENTPLAPVQGLQNAMRRGEAALTCELAAGADVVFLDGPLTFVTSVQGPVVGFVKRLLRSYLPAAEAALLRALEPGWRTPLFRIDDPRHPRYSWYARIARGRPIESPLTGIVRLETAECDLAAARALADLCTAYLPGFASDAAHDPRAPQNLYPIGALEARLRHLLGDARLVRRAVEARLHAEALA